MNHYEKLRVYEKLSEIETILIEIKNIIELDEMQESFSKELNQHKQVKEMKKDLEYRIVNVLEEQSASLKTLIKILQEQNKMLSAKEK